MDDLSLSYFIPVMIFMIPITAIFGAFVYLIVRTLSRARVRELEIRERIAMIERGLVPAPEVDPRGFERAMDRHDQMLLHKTPVRLRRGGIIIMGLGFGLMVLIGFAGDAPSVGIGVGGSIAILGLAVFLNSLFDSDRDLPPLGRYPAPPPPMPPAPPVAQAEQRLD